MLARDGVSHWLPEPGLELRRLTCHGLLDEAAARAPERDALVYLTGPEVRWSFAELRARSRETARALLALDLEAGDRVALWATNIPEWLLLQFGCSYAGLTLVPLNPLYRAGEVGDVVGRSGAKALFVVPQDRGASLWEMALEARERAPSLRHVLPIGAGEGGDGSTWAGFLAGAASVSEEALDAVAAGVQPEDLAQIQFTSGTTGAPKGAALHHAGITDDARLFAERAEIGEEGRMCTAMPLFHCGGSVLAVLGSIATRTTLMPLVRFDPRTLIDTVDAEQANSIGAVPAMLLAIEEELERGGGSLESLEIVISGGSLVPPEILRRYGERFGARFSITYGQTEASPVITQSSPSDPFEQQAATVGRALAHVEVDVADPATGQPVAIGEQGEVRTRGWLVMEGYFGDEAATREAITPDGWLRTGDLGRMDDEGYVRITGRARDMVIRGGENIYPAEVEAAIRALDGVLEAFVVGVPDDRYGEVCAAFVRLADGASLDLAGLREQLAGSLARYKIPAHLRVVDAYPLTPSGKVQKFRLREEFLTEAESEPEPAA